MESILNKLQDWYDKHFSSQEDEDVKLQSPNFHHHKILTYAADLRNTELPMEQRAKAAQYIGLLTYTGGVSAAMLASNYIQDMIDMLTMPDTSSNVRIPILKGLSSMCYINYVNQNRAKELHLIDIIIACLDEDDEDTESNLKSVKFWACYLMYIISCNNIPCIKLFQDSGGQLLQNRLEELSNLGWEGWPENYADVMIGLLDYKEMKGKQHSSVMKPESSLMRWWTKRDSSMGLRSKRESSVGFVANQESSLLALDENPASPVMGQGAIQERSEVRSEGKRESLDKTSEGKRESLDKTSEGKRESLDKTSEGKRESLDKRPEGKRESLDKRPEGKRESLDKRPEGKRESLDKRPETKLESLEKKLERRRESSEKRLERRRESSEKRLERRRESSEKRLERRRESLGQNIWPRRQEGKRGSFDIRPEGRRSLDKRSD